MYIHGILLGLISFACIGVFHPVVIKSEYYFGARCWPAFLAAGIVLMGVSAAVSDVFLSAIVGVIGFSCFWSILELKQQEKRVEKGWFPDNPNRKKKQVSK